MLHDQLGLIKLIECQHLRGIQAHPNCPAFQNISCTTVTIKVFDVLSYGCLESR